MKIKPQDRVYVYNFLVAGIISISPGIIAKLLLIGIYLWVLKKILKEKENRVALKYIYFISGLEIFTKISGLYITWTWTPQFIILLFVVLCFKNTKFNLFNPFFGYFILLTPGLFFFHISDIKVALSYLYPSLILMFGYGVFQNLNIRGKEINEYYKWMIIGFIYCGVYLLINSKSIDSIEYGHFTSNEAVGFSGNQFTNAIAVGLVIIFFVFYYKIELGSKLILSALFIFLLYKSFATVSRGGVFAAGSAIISTVLVDYFKGRNGKINLKYIFFGVVIVLSLYQYVNMQTNDALNLRYLGKSEILDYELKDYTTGRSLITAGDWVTFYNNPIMGVGVANSGINNVFIAIKSHNEYMRHLSEHGLFGIFALFILFKTIGKSLIRWNYNSEVIGITVLFLLFLYQGSTRVTAEFLLLLLIFVKPKLKVLKTTKHVV